MRRVFVWDAEEDSRLAMQRLLSHRGFTVESGGRSAGEVEETLERSRWDLVMADPSPAIPEFLGVLVRVSRARPGLPIFLVTYYGKHEKELAGLRPVCRYIFEKPVDLRQVDEALETVFSGD